MGCLPLLSSNTLHHKKKRTENVRYDFGCRAGIYKSNLGLLIHLLTTIVQR